MSGITNFFVSDTSNTDYDNVFEIKGYILKPEGFWKNYVRDYTVTNTDKPFYFAICNPPLPMPEEDQTSIELQNILVRKITFPRILLYSSSEDGGNAASDKITVSHDMQMTYTFNSNSLDNNTKILSLLDRYDDGWKLAGNNNHFIVNGFANGWLLDKNNNNGIISLASQEYVSLGFKISGFTVLIIIVIFLIKRKKL